MNDCSPLVQTTQANNEECVELTALDGFLLGLPVGIFVGLEVGLSVTPA